MKPFTILICTLVVGLFSATAFARQAPDWTLNDAEGNPVSLSDYRGKPLILHFWATWCPYCTKLQPGLEKLYREYREDGLEVLAISFLEDEGARPQQTLKKRGHSFKTVLNGEGVASEYGVQGTPTTFFIGRDGTLVWKTSNSDPADPALEEAVLFLLKE